MATRKIELTSKSNHSLHLLFSPTSIARLPSLISLSEGPREGGSGPAQNTPPQVGSWSHTRSRTVPYFLLFLGTRQRKMSNINWESLDAKKFALSPNVPKARKFNEYKLIWAESVSGDRLRHWKNFKKTKNNKINDTREICRLPNWLWLINFPNLWQETLVFLRVLAGIKFISYSQVGR